MSADEAWAKIAPTVDFICGVSAKQITYQEYMECYTYDSNPNSRYIQSYCTSSGMTGSSSSLSGKGKIFRTAPCPTARLMVGVGINGGEIYYRLRNHLTSHFHKVTNSCSHLSDEALLLYYAKQWTTFLQSVV
jgi:hypothetical protein